jgi:uncharacterized membrane protein
MNASFTQHYSQSSRYDPQQAESEMQKMAAFLAGGSAIAFGLARKGFLSRMLAVGGGYLLYRTMASGDSPNANDVLVSQTINKPPREVYAFLREPQHWPSLGGTFASSSKGDQGTNEAMQEPLMEITDEAQDRTLRWRFHGEDAELELSAHFAPAPGNRGTEVWLFAECMSPMSSLRQLLKSATRNSLEQLVREHLRGCKRLMEAGEILTTEGQPSGYRGMKGKAMRALFRESTGESKPAASAGEIPSGQRAAS